jgi:hypothetical protein
MLIESGDAILPKTPGLGVEIDRAKLEKYATTLSHATAALS